jgi:small-conductance mechanosensitive channel
VFWWSCQRQLGKKLDGVNHSGDAAAQAEINQAVAEQLRAANISIPFPKREVRLLNRS